MVPRQEILFRIADVSTSEIRIPQSETSLLLPRRSVPCSLRLIRRLLRFFELRFKSSDLLFHQAPLTFPFFG